MTRLQLDTFNQQRIAPFKRSFRPYPKELDFEVDYITPPEQDERERYLEEKEIKIDNVEVRKQKNIFSKL